MNRLSWLVYDRCLSYVNELQLLNTKCAISEPLSRYILSMHCAIPIQHIVLAERPYGTNILPYVAPAMSYDIELDPTPTPSVHYLSLAINEGSNASYEDSVAWFRDSWKYLNHGIILLNVCCLYKFTDRRSEKERVSTEKFVSDIIFMSMKLSNEQIHIYAMGNPAKHSANRIRSSILNPSRKVVIHGCNNPASLQHKRDTRSPVVTLGSKRLVMLLGNIVVSTQHSNRILTYNDYTKMASASQTDLTRLVNQGGNVAQTFDDIESYFKTNKGKTVENNDELFGRAAREMREFILVLQSTRVQLLFANAVEPTGTSKQAYYNSRQDYNKTKYTPGSASRVSSTPTSTVVTKIGFADDDEIDPDSSVTSNPVSPSKTALGKQREQPTLPTTPTPIRRNISTAMSTMSRNSVNVGIVEESDEDDSTSGSNVNTPKSNDIDMTESEVDDMSYISDFMDSAGAGEYSIQPSVAEFIRESVRMKRAKSSVAQEALAIIRATRASSTQRSIENSLGYALGGVVDVPSDIVQWILKKQAD